MSTNKNFGITYGLIYGVVAILMTVVLYLFGVKAFTSPVAYIGFVIPIVIATLAAKAEKKANGGFLEFGAALKTTFTCLVIGTLLSTAFSYVLFNFIDIPFREALAQETSEATARMMEKFGASQDDIDKAMADAQTTNNFSFSKQALGFAFSCIFWFLVSLIISAIVKRKKPEFV